MTILSVGEGIIRLKCYQIVNSQAKFFPTGAKKISEPR